MKPYLLSLGAGILVGAIYSLLHVRSPAPPTIALIGLLGILLGEQIPPILSKIVRGHDALAYVRGTCAEQVLGPQAARKEDEAA